jgi:hypothetical protein
MTEHESGVLTDDHPPQVTPGAAVALHLPAELLRCPPPPPSRTKWTRLVHPAVLTGPAGSVNAGEPIAAPLAAVDGGGNVASAAPAAR